MMPAKSTAKSFFINAFHRTFASFVQGNGDTKHTKCYADYGYPETITFNNYYGMWKRNGLARAGVNKPIETCWQEFPELTEKEETHDKTTLEKTIADELERLMFWSNLSEADKFSRVGEYAGVIFRFRDNKMPDQPVDSVAGGLEGIAEIIPALQGQLKPLEYFDDPRLDNYGQVKMWQFSEASLPGMNGKDNRNRQFSVHPDRVHIWSRNSSVFGEPALEAGFNDLITMQKIIGAGGEAFWKNAKNAPIMNIDPASKIADLAKMMGVKQEEMGDKIDEIVKDFNSGLDASILLQGIDTKTLNISMPDPEKPFLVALQSYAASLSIPLKILVGSQSGERASTEDAKEWNKTCNSRRTNYIKPNVMRIIERFVQYGVLPDLPWYLQWSDLTESSTAEKFEIVGKMADANQKMLGSGVAVFTSDEMRETAGWDGSADMIIPKRDKTIDTKPTPKGE